MPTPFPGMDPYLEDPKLWPDVHNSLIAAIRDDLAPRLAPRYFVGLEERVYRFDSTDFGMIGVADVVVAGTERAASKSQVVPTRSGRNVLKVKLPTLDTITETYLKIREVRANRLVTLIEVRSPANKISGAGRRSYLKKRANVLASRSHFIEIDLLRAGKPMPLQRTTIPTDYRILVSRESLRPSADLHVFRLRDPIPTIPLPLLPGDQEPLIDLGQILHALYERARYDLRLDYEASATPPLSEEDSDWARRLIGDL